MYGNAGSVSAGSGAVLAATGLHTAWMFFAAVTLIFTGVALLSLARRGGKVRP
jgi:hypothetical protein